MKQWCSRSARRDARCYFGIGWWRCGAARETSWASGPRRGADVAVVERSIPTGWAGTMSTSRSRGRGHVDRRRAVGISAGRGWPNRWPPPPDPQRGRPAAHNDRARPSYVVITIARSAGDRASDPRTWPDWSASTPSARCWLLIAQCRWCGSRYHRAREARPYVMPLNVVWAGASADHGVGADRLGRLGRVMSARRGRYVGQAGLDFGLALYRSNARRRTRRDQARHGARARVREGPPSRSRLVLVPSSAIARRRTSPDGSRLAAEGGGRPTRRRARERRSRRCGSRGAMAPTIDARLPTRRSSGAGACGAPGGGRGVRRASRWHRDGARARPGSAIVEEVQRGAWRCWSRGLLGAGGFLSAVGTLGRGSSGAVFLGACRVSDVFFFWFRVCRCGVGGRALVPLIFSIPSLVPLPIPIHFPFF